MENKQQLDEIMGVAVNSAKDQGVGVTDKVNLNLDDFIFLYELAEKAEEQSRKIERLKIEKEKAYHQGYKQGKYEELMETTFGG
ncbi:hypothetical protein [Bacillus sp. SM2101]|uniref:hypothetical protein n=1 Tax=Bacillus sp. SM2101 TaxID=2805366 RepID=UPI001BDF3C2E|nr:hypothetical protein [Bacillus sp. SM2101]